MIVGRDLPLITVGCAGIATRVIYVAAYPHAFFTPDSVVYLHAAQRWVPSFMRPSGYALFLLPFVHTVVGAAMLVQHLLGLALIIGGYAFVTSRGANRWLAAAAVLPVALDARVLTLEHFILAESLFTALVAAGLFMLLWGDRVRLWVAAVAGVLLAYAAVVRSVGLPVLALTGAYLLIRRVGWRVLAGFTMPVIAVLGGYLLWYHQNYGVYAFTEYQGRFLYARVMTIADCPRLILTPAQRTLCPVPDPLRHLRRTDEYIWNHQSPAHALYHARANDPLLNGFAWTVISQQPGDYLLMVVRETSWHFLPSPPMTDDMRCLSSLWEPPSSTIPGCRNANAATPGLLPGAGTSSLRSALAGYGGVANLPGLLLAGCLIGTGIGALWRPSRARRLAAPDSHHPPAAPDSHHPPAGPDSHHRLAGPDSSRRLGGDALFIGAVGFSLIVVSVATSMYEPRYAVPAVFFLPIAAALALHRVLLV